MRSLSCIEVLDKLSGDLDEPLVSGIDEWTANGCDSGRAKEDAVEGMGELRDVDIAGDVLDDNLDAKNSPFF